MSFPFDPSQFQLADRQAVRDAGAIFSATAYHGTTHAFTKFNASIRGNPEGFLGRVNYFTSSFSDARDNYAGIGHDLDNRIEQLTEQISNEVHDDPEAAGLSRDADDEEISAFALSQAKSRLVGATPRVSTYRLAFSNPFIIDGRRGQFRPHKSVSGLRSPALFQDDGPDWDDQVREVLGRHGVLNPSQEEMREAEDLYSDEICELGDARREEKAIRLLEAFDEAALHYDMEVPTLPGILYDDLEGLTHQTFFEALRNDEELSSLSDWDTGSLISNEFIGRVIFHLGFDAVVLLHADAYFQGMEMEAETTHYQIPDHLIGNVVEIETESVD